MMYWDASGIVPLLVRQARTQDMERLLTQDPTVVTQQFSF
jgi:predicted nucleic acid-binding protein